MFRTRYRSFLYLKLSFILFNSLLIFQPSFANDLPSTCADCFSEFNKTIQQDPINDLLVNHYDSREGLEVRAFSFIRVDASSANANILAKNARVELYIRVNVTTSRGPTFSLIYQRSEKLRQRR